MAIPPVEMASGPTRRGLAAITGLALLRPHAAAATPIELRAADGVQVFGTHLAAGMPRRRGTILLFHMAGFNRAEYAPIAPELARLGFDSLAIDQRSGGDAWGQRNQTASLLPRDPGYRVALPDLQAALAWARQRDATGPVLAWGSSYSAALVFLLAAQAGDGVSALIAFSPDEYLGNPPVRASAAMVRCPVFVTGAADAEEAAAAGALLAAVRGAPKRQYRPTIGVHGSSTLRVDRNPRGAAACWAAVTSFLDEVTPT